MTVAASADGRRDGRTGVTAAAPASGGITVWHTAGASLIRVAGDLDVRIVPLLQTELASAVVGRAWTIVDLSLVTAVDRVALNTLVKGSCAARARGGEMLLVAPRDPVVTALRTARMGTVFTVFATMSRALSAVSADGFSARPR